MRTVIIAITLLFSSGCASSTQTPLEAQFRDSIGKKITLVGVADQASGGAAAWNDECYVVIEGLASWPEGVLGQKIEVTGTLHSVDRPNGVTHTDYRKAAILLIISHATWKKKEPIQLPEPMSGLAPGHGSS